MGPLAEDYVAKIAPKSKIGGPGAFKMPMKMPTHMEYYEEDVLAEALKEMIEIVKDIEIRKNKLALKPDFNMHDLFNIFDINGNGSFNLREFCEVCDMFKIWTPYEFQRMAFVNLDRDLDQKISLKEFLDGFGPKDKNYREVVFARDSYNKGANFQRLESFTPGTTRDTVGLIKAICEAECQFERVRDNLRLRRNFNYK